MPWIMLTKKQNAKKNFMISYNTNQDYDHILVFFPFAGGSGELYTPWFKYFSSNIFCIYAELKGRGKYFHENAFDTIEELIDDLLPKLYPILDKPFSFFGHSMGALIAFELGKSLYKKFITLHLVIYLPQALDLQVLCIIENIYTKCLKKNYFEKYKN